MGGEVGVPDVAIPASGGEWRACALARRIKVSQGAHRSSWAGRSGRWGVRVGVGSGWGVGGVGVGVSGRRSRSGGWVCVLERGINKDVRALDTGVHEN